MTRPGHSLRRAIRVVVCLAMSALLAPAASAATATRPTQKTQKSSPAPRTVTTSSGKAPAKASASAGTKSKSSYSASSAAARRARLARARAAAQARDLAAAKVPRFRIDEHGDLVPDVRAEAAIIYNPATGQVIWETGGYGQRSIASITKVMTALCFLEDEPDLSREVTVARTDVRGASTTFLRANERIRLQDVLHLALVASDNVAARTLARASAYGTEGFVTRMNQKAAELGLTSTRFADPSGLDARNISSAYDLARLIAYAAEDERLSVIMRTSDYTCRTSRRTVTVHNTNQLVRTADLDVRGGKTGFISKAGHCLATLLRLPQVNQTYAVVVLGARSNNGRFWETRHLFNWLASRAPVLLSNQGGDGGVPPVADDSHK